MRNMTFKMQWQNPLTANAETVLFQWFKNDLPFANQLTMNATSTATTVTSVIPVETNDRIFGRVTFVNESGSVTTDSETFTVPAPPPPTAPVVTLTAS